MADEFENIKALPTRVDLRERYPLAFRAIFARSFWALLAEALAIIGYIYSSIDIDQLDNAIQPLESAADNTLYYILQIVTVVCIIKLIYEYLFWIFYSYSIEVEHLTIVRGLFLRTRASFPIAKINDISLKRNIIDFLFGLYAVDILTASPEIKFAEIYGLSRKNSVNLQGYLLTLVETTLPDVKERAAEKVIEGDFTSEQIDTIIHKASR